jgi:hypothetical protein
MIFAFAKSERIVASEWGRQEQGPKPKLWTVGINKITNARLVIRLVQKKSLGRHGFGEGAVALLLLLLLLLPAARFLV